jgi:hypothetical protein
MLWSEPCLVADQADSVTLYLCRWRWPGSAQLCGVPEELHGMCVQAQGCANDTKGLLEQPAQGHHLFQGAAGASCGLSESGLRSTSAFCLLRALFGAAAADSLQRQLLARCVQANVQAMEAAEERATAVYRR